MTRIINFNNKQILLLIILVIFTNTLCWAKNNKHVLVIHSYNYSFPTTLPFLDGLNSVFDTLNIKSDIEFMDWKKFPTEENENIFYDNIRHKLNLVQPYDAIITSDDKALEFVLKHQKELFSNIPIVFSGVNNKKLAQEQNNNQWITGIIESISIKENIDLMKQLYPNSKDIFYIVDNTITANNDLTELLKNTINYPELNFNKIDLKNYSFNELKRELTKIHSGDPVLLISAYQDKNGNTKSFEESIEIIKNNLSAPLFHLYEHGLGEGIIGGKLVSHDKLGKQVALLIKQILNGTPISQLPVIENSNNEYTFDYNELQKKNIDISDLPKNAEIMNSPISFYEINKKAIWLYSVFFILQSIVLIRLFRINKRRKKIQTKLRKKVYDHYKLSQSFKKVNDALYVKNNELLTTEEELRANNEELYEKNERIAESEEKYRLLFNNLNEAYALHEIVLDESNEPIDFIFRDVNPKLLENVNLTHEKIINKSVKEIFPQTEDHWIKKCGNVAKYGTPMRFRDYSVETNSYYETTVFSPKPNFFAAVYMDVTKETTAAIEVQKAYDKVKIKESIFKKMFNSAPVVMIILNKNSEILDINKTGLELLKKDASKTLGKRGGDFLSCINSSLDKKGCGQSHHCESCVLNNSVNKTIVSKQNVNKTEFDINIKDEFGSIKTLNFHISTAILPDKDEDKILVCMENVTSLKHNEEQLKKRNSEIKQLLNAAKQILTVNDFNKTIDSIFNYCMSITNSSSGFVGIKNGEFTDILFKNINGKENDQKYPISKTKNELLKSIYNKKEVYIDNNFNNSNLPHNHIHIKNIIITPIIIKNEPIGVIALSNKDKDYNIEDINILSAFTELAALSFNNTRSNILVEESEHKFKQTYYTSPDAIAISSFDGTFININKSFTEMFGHKEEDVIGKKATDIDLWYNLDHRNHLLNELKSNGKIINYETKLKSKDNRTITGLLSASIVKTNNDSHLLIICRDITQLKLQSYYLNKAQEIGNIGSWSYNVSSKTFTWSDQCYKMFGFNKDAILSFENILSIVHPDDKSMFIDRWQNCLLGEKYVMDFRIVVNGKTKWIYQKVDIEFTSDKNVSKIIGVKMDITLRKDYEWQITQINKRFKGLEEIVTYKAQSIPDLLDHTLSKVISYTNSDIGAVYHYDEYKSIFYLNNWTTEYNLTVDSSKINCLNQAVQSKKAVIINENNGNYDFLINEEKKINNLKSLTIPILANGKVVAVFWVASAKHNYHDFHARQVMLLLETTWIIVEKQRLQEKL